MPRLTLIAGPDGAGKSTLARQAGFDGPFANADNHARDIDPGAPEAAAVAAGRETLAQLSLLIRGRRDGVYETTLSGTTRCGLSTGPRPPATRSRLCLSPCRAQTSPS